MLQKLHMMELLFFRAANGKLKGVSRPCMTLRRHFQQKRRHRPVGATHEARPWHPAQGARGSMSCPKSGRHLSLSSVAPPRQPLYDRIDEEPTQDQELALEQDTPALKSPSPTFLVRCASLPRCNHATCNPLAGVAGRLGLEVVRIGMDD